MNGDERNEDVAVRVARPEDARFADRASALIRAAARDHDIAERDPELLREKLETGRAVLALRGDELVGFGFFSEWEGGKFVSHSGLVVDESMRGRGLGRGLKLRLFEASESMFPNAVTMSLTTSEAVRAMNLSLGFRVVPFEQMTDDPDFWAGCRTCRNYEATRRAGIRCCCEGMVRAPGGGV